MSGARREVRLQRHPFMVAAGWVVAVALVITVVPCCLIYLGVQSACRLVSHRISRLRVPGSLQR
jgi:hypothetical protein